MRKKNTTFSKRNIRRYTLLITVLFFGILGVYATLFTRAATPDFNPSQPLYVEASESYNKGPDPNYFSNNVNVHVTTLGGYTKLPRLTLAVLLLSNSERRIYHGYKCYEGIKCINAKVKGAPSIKNLNVIEQEDYMIKSGQRYIPDHPRVDQVICFQVPAGFNYSGAGLFAYYGLAQPTAFEESGTFPPYADAFAAVAPPDICKPGVDLTNANWFSRDTSYHPLVACGGGSGVACFRGTKDGGGTGNNTGGNGNGNGGSGKDTGTKGSGTGKNGAGSGGGGSSATKQADTPKPTPALAPQGTKETDPPEQEPSPFYDGKQYSIGSDPDAQTPADLVKNPGKVFVNVWLYVIGGVILAAAGAGGYWWWRRHRSKR